MIKSTGIIRKIDQLGRIVIPMEVRRNFNIDVQDPIEISVEKGKIVLAKVSNNCIICDRTNKLVTFKGKMICQNCFDSMKNFS